MSDDKSLELYWLIHWGYEVLVPGTSRNYFLLDRVTSLYRFDVKDNTGKVICVMPC